MARELDFLNGSQASIPERESELIYKAQTDLFSSGSPTRVSWSAGSVRKVLYFVDEKLRGDPLEAFHLVF